MLHRPRDALRQVGRQKNTNRCTSAQSNVPILQAGVPDTSLSHVHSLRLSPRLQRPVPYPLACTVEVSEGQRKQTG